jgi:hypothetical protein
MIHNWPILGLAWCIGRTRAKQQVPNQWNFLRLLNRSQKAGGRLVSGSPAIILILILFLSAVNLSAQSPEHRFFDRNNLIGFTAMYAGGALDHHSTCRSLRAGYRETFMPTQSCRTIGIAIYGTSTGIVGLSYWMHRKGHHKIERWLPRLRAIGGGVVASWNYRL